MSDRELVTIDAAQFNALILRLDVLAGRLGPTGSEFSLHQALTHIERTLFDGLKLIAQAQNGGDNSQVLTAINNLDRKVDKMSSNIDRIEKEAADAAENVGLIKTAMDELKSVSEAMKTEIAALKERVAKGQIDQARLEAAAATFEKADEDIDALVLPSSGETSDTAGVITGDEG